MFAFEKGGEKWGGLSISSSAQFEKAKPWIKESRERMNVAVKNNEPTGWYAKVDDIGGDD